MADYNIYIHAIGTANSNANNPTVPWSQREGGEGSNPTVPQSGGYGGFNIGIMGGLMGMGRSAIANPTSLVGASVLPAAQAGAIAFAAFVAVKTAHTIYKNAVDFYGLITGQHRLSFEYEENIKGMSLLHPISTLIERQKIYITQRHENDKKALERELLGDSVINSYSNRGV